MTDIYDIKDIILLSPISVTNTIFVCIIFLMIYFLLFKKPHPNPFLKKEREQDQTIEESKIDYKKFISGFEKNYMSLDSKDFLKEISFIFRSFLEQDLGYENFSKLTLEEITQTSFNSPLLRGEIEQLPPLDKGRLGGVLQILQDIYFKEYRGDKLTLKQKEKIFLEVKSIILSKEK